jgi:hypothetical protein
MPSGHNNKPQYPRGHGLLTNHVTILEVSCFLGYNAILFHEFYEHFRKACYLHLQVPCSQRRVFVQDTGYYLLVNTAHPRGLKSYSRLLRQPHISKY